MEAGNIAAGDPSPFSPDDYSIDRLPDQDFEFIQDAEVDAFTKALQPPDDPLKSPDLASTDHNNSTQFITALNDWRPVKQRVRKGPRPGRKKRKKVKRGKDETREGFVYALLKWPLLVFVLTWIVCLFAAYLLTRLYIWTYESGVSLKGKREALRKRLQSAKTYDEWVDAARNMDRYLGNDEWKQKDDYAYYNSETIRIVRNRLHKLRTELENVQSSATNDDERGGETVAEELRSLIESSVKDNFVGVENARLYSETYYGTKQIIQSFLAEVSSSLQLLSATSHLSLQSKSTMFTHLSANYGRTAFALSGGATFAYFHFGVAKALLDADVLPSIITGTSGGALVAALLCTRTDEELKHLLVPALAYRINACSESVYTTARRWWRTGAQFDSIDWARRCSWFSRGSLTFLEAYQRTGRILNITCIPSDPHSPTVLANYLTSPDCVIWSAVLASAAVPGILNPVVLMRKTKTGDLEPYSFGHKWKDGSLRTDIPLKALNSHFNVTYSIVSQVNPHINLFFFSSRGTVGRPVTHRRGRGWRGGFLGSATEQYLKLDLTKWLKVLRHLELLPRYAEQDWSNIWLQRFDGTITIWPKSRVSDFWHILSDPTPGRLARMLWTGMLSCWPKVKFIQNRMMVEGAIHDGVRRFVGDADRVRLRANVGAPAEDVLSGTLSEEDVAGLAHNGSSTKLRTNFSSTASGRDPSSPSFSQRLSSFWPAPTRTTSDPQHRKRHSWTPTPNLTIPRTPSPSTSHQPSADRSRQPRNGGSVFEELTRQAGVFVDDTDAMGGSDSETEGSEGDVAPLETPLAEMEEMRLAGEVRDRIGEADGEGVGSVVGG